MTRRYADDSSYDQKIRDICGKPLMDKLSDLKIVQAQRKFWKDDQVKTLRNQVILISQVQRIIKGQEEDYNLFFKDPITNQHDKNLGSVVKRMNQTLNLGYESAIDNIIIEQLKFRDINNDVINQTFLSLGLQNKQVDSQYVNLLRDLTMSQSDKIIYMMIDKQSWQIIQQSQNKQSLIIQYFRQNTSTNDQIKNFLKTHHNLKQAVQSDQGLYTRIQKIVQRYPPSIINDDHAHVQTFCLIPQHVQNIDNLLQKLIDSQYVSVNQETSMIVPSQSNGRQFLLSKQFSMPAETFPVNVRVSSFYKAILNRNTDEFQNVVIKDAFLTREVQMIYRLYSHIIIIEIAAIWTHLIKKYVTQGQCPTSLKGQSNGNQIQSLMLEPIIVGVKTIINCIPRQIEDNLRQINNFQFNECPLSYDFYDDQKQKKIRIAVFVVRFQDGQPESTAALVPVKNEFLWRQLLVEIIYHQDKELLIDYVGKILSKRITESKGKSQINL